MDHSPKFRLIQYNPRRHARGAEAAMVEVTWPDGEKCDLWMSKKDISMNIKEWGTSEGLQAALDAYKKNQPIEA